MALSVLLKQRTKGMGFALLKPISYCFLRSKNHLQDDKGVTLMWESEPWRIFSL
jgi:hypothetical protein